MNNNFAINMTVKKLKNIFSSNLFYFENNFTMIFMIVIQYFLSFSIVSDNLLIMEEDILNYSPTAMFRGTPCSFLSTSPYCPPVLVAELEMNLQSGAIYL